MKFDESGVQRASHNDQFYAVLYRSVLILIVFKRCCMGLLVGYIYIRDYKEKKDENDEIIPNDVVSLISLFLTKEYERFVWIIF